MPTKAASKPAAKPRSTKTMVSLPRARKSKPLTLKGDTSKPGGQIIKGLFEAAGHTVVDTSSHADDAAPYLNALHGKPAKRSVQADIDICQGRLDSHVARIQELEARHTTLNSTITDVVQRLAALQFAHDQLESETCKDRGELRVEVTNRIKNRDDILKMVNDRDLCIGKLQTRVDDLNKQLADIVEKQRNVIHSVEGANEIEANVEYLQGKCSRADTLALWAVGISWVALVLALSAYLSA